MSTTNNSLNKNLEAYWDSEYYSENNKFELDNYIFDVKNAVVHLIGDLEGDYTMIFQWFLNNNIIDHNLNWIADSNVYVIQVGDQVDKFREIQVKDEGKYQGTRRIRSEIINRFGSDIDTVIFFDYLSFVSKMKYGSERVFSLLGNHEVMNLNQDLRYSFNHSSNNKYARFERAALLNIMSNDGSPVRNILLKRPVIMRFNNLVISHAGLNLSSIEAYTRFSNKMFNIDEYIESINKISPESYRQENLYYKYVIEPLLWNRDYQQLNSPLNKEEFEEIKDNIIVLGHNSFSNVVVCGKGSCNYLKEFEDKYPAGIVRMVKVDTGISSRFCKNDQSNIYTAIVSFDNYEVNNMKEKLYGFNCESATYPKVSFVRNEIVKSYL